METMSRIQQRLAPELRELNSLMEESLSSGNELLSQIVTMYLTTKGKQIRPLLVLLSAKMFGDVNTNVLYAAAALEMLHNASLIHDDVVDDTELRRGLPTINANWGNHIAVLVGDFFVSNALAAGIRTGSVEVVASLSALGKELSIGEIEQIGNVRAHSFDTESYFSMIRKKTASLFRNCVRLGAVTSGAREDEIKPIVEYAELLGECFQIKDDIFDYYDSKEIGKPTGNDLREGKVTLPLIYALQDAPQSESEAIKTLIRRGDLTEKEIEGIIAFTKQYGGIDKAYAEMRRIQEKANKIISTYPDSEWKLSFHEIFEFIIERRS